jgi:hypothetical protein|tara:strand:+ start:1301 stop:1495 length:195 start_codon:yes stop_codon:yes gene_type:complete
MPQVGNKHFGYGPAGVAKAKKEAARTGIPMKTGYHAGGKVKNRKIAARGKGAATRGFYARGPMA